MQVTCDTTPNHERSLCARLGSVPVTGKFYFQNPPYLIAALHWARDVAASYILICLRRQVSCHSESICTPVHTSLRSFLTKGLWPITLLYISNVTWYVVIALRWPSLHQYLRRRYLPLTSSSQQTTRHHYRGWSDWYVTIVTWYVVIALRWPSLHQYLRRRYQSLTSSSQQTTRHHYPLRLLQRRQITNPNPYTHHLSKTPTMHPALHTHISTPFPTTFFTVWRHSSQRLNYTRLTLSENFPASHTYQTLRRNFYGYGGRSLKLHYCTLSLTSGPTHTKLYGGTRSRRLTSNVTHTPTKGFRLPFILPSSRYSLLYSFFNFRVQRSCGKRVQLLLSR